MADKSGNQPLIGCQINYGNPMRSWLTLSKSPKRHSTSKMDYKVCTSALIGTSLTCRYTAVKSTCPPPDFFSLSHLNVSAHPTSSNIHNIHNLNKHRRQFLNDHSTCWK